MTYNTHIDAQSPTTPLSPRIAMPLLNTPFAPGHTMEAVEAMADPDSRRIALAEYHYFSGRTDLAAELAEPYLEHGDIALRLSACWLYVQANIALDRVPQARTGMAMVQSMVDALGEDTPVAERALTVCASTAMDVLLHRPLPKILAPFKAHIRTLPPGLRLLVFYIEAHHAYLNKQYGAAVGIAETALAMADATYPIPSIYLHLVASMGYTSLARPDEAQSHFSEAWSIARPDDLIEPLAEHHRLLGTTPEQCLRQEPPEELERITAIVLRFTAGWRKLHTPGAGHSELDHLTNAEFAAAMLAARDWPNREIAAHLGLSEHTVRRYISTTLQRLKITKRQELARFMLG